MAKPRVLIIDDDSRHAGETRALLAELGCESEAAGSVPEGLTVLGKTRFDLVVSSMLLPGLGGLDLLRMLRAAKDEMLYAVPVAILTRCAQADYLRQARELGAAEYLLKPVAPDEFKARIRKLLEAQGYRFETRA